MRNFSLPRSTINHSINHKLCCKVLLNEWKEKLNDTLHIALSNNCMEDTGDTIDLLGIKKNIDKLVDACHLVRVCEFEWRDGEAILKTPNTGNNEKKTAAKRR